jgi:N-acetylglucosamine-6-sulfatase
VADLSVMPRTRRLLGSGGVTFRRAYATTPLCCPSRASLLTGLYAHNHGVTSNEPPDGGAKRFDASSALPVWLRRSGYRTIHVGRYLNGYGTDVPAEEPPGWSEWHGAVEPRALLYWGYELSEGGEVHRYGEPTDEDPRLYQTDVYASKAQAAIRSAAGRGPFYLELGFLAPHVEGPYEGQRNQRPRPGPRDAGRLAAARLPSPPSFDEADVSDKPSFVRSRPRLRPTQISALEETRRARLEALLAVDRAVARLVATLRAAGELQRTFLLFTSDNGFLSGEHRIKNGKGFAYEPSSRVPMLLRGPGIPPGATSDELVANIDMAPTVLDLARARADRPLDGRSLIPYASDPARRSQRPLLLESGRRFRGVRLGRWAFVSYQGREAELYDLDRDPFELNSLDREPRYAGVRRSLRLLLDRIQDCRAAACRADARIPPAPG